MDDGKRVEIKCFSEYFNGRFQIQIDQGPAKSARCRKIIYYRPELQFPRQSPSVNVLLPPLRSFNEDEEATASVA